MQWPGLIRASVSTRRRLWHWPAGAGLSFAIQSLTPGSHIRFAIVAQLEPRSITHVKQSCPQVRAGCGAVNAGRAWVARDAPPLHQGPWPIYNGVVHQPTRDEMRASHHHDLTPGEAHEIDRLYDQLLSSSDPVQRRR
jgi:hypothetical protein